MDPLLVTALLGLAATLAATTVLWLVSLPLRDVSIVDIYWGPGFALLAWIYLARADEPGARAWLVAGLVTLWALRLAAYLAWRNLGKGEDRRYAEMRERRGEAFRWQSLFIVFWLQGALQWVIGAPLLAAVALGGGPLGRLDAAASALFVIGFLFESIGDWQLARFKSGPANEGAVMDRGLWRYTRHPNYFGDAVLWWGYGLFAVAAGHPWALAGPAIMTWLLLKFSGVALLEKDIGERRPGYREYVERTNAFLPGPPGE